MVTDKYRMRNSEKWFLISTEEVLVDEKGDSFHFVASVGSNTNACNFANIDNVID
jgi:hypothetical protein